MDVIIGEDGVFKEYDPFCTVDFETEEDFEFMKAAVEKQIPKKPHIEEDSIGDKYLECQNCGCFIGCKIDCEYEPYRISFCHNCGQKIDWSD